MRWSKFFYMTTVPSHKDLQWPQVEPTPEDFTASMRRHVDPTLNKEPRKGKVFTVPGGFVIPKAVNFKVSNLKKVERSAGTAANQRAAAATAWVLANAEQNFVNGPMAWTGKSSVIDAVHFC